MRRIDLNSMKDLTSIDWALPIHGSSNGVLPKSIINWNRDTLYLKLPSYDEYFGFYGNETIMELINSRIGAILGLPVLDYGLVRANVKLNDTIYETYVSVSRDYAGGNKVISFEKYFYINRTGKEEPLAFVKRLNLEQVIYQQFIYDFIICNFDRHSRNNDIILTENSIQLAPFFDNSATFIGKRPDNEIDAKKKYNDQIRVNNFIGTQFLLQNIHLIDREIVLRYPRKADRDLLFQGLDEVTTGIFRDYIWEMLFWRVEDVAREKIPFIRWK